MKTNVKKATTKKAAPSKAERIKTRIAKLEARNKVASERMTKRTERIKALRTKLAAL